MPIVVSVDLGTTKITSLAVEAGSWDVLAVGTTANDANVTSDADRQRGRSEWDARRIAAQGLACVKQVAMQLGSRVGEIAGIGITGQQHGVVLIDSLGEPVSPLINWQDRRALDAMPVTSGATGGFEPPVSSRSLANEAPRQWQPTRGTTWLQSARDVLGEDSWRRTGCRLHPGFMAVTLLWLKANGLLPNGVQSCFVMDYFGAVLTDRPPITEPSCAGSSGVFDVRSRRWDEESIHALGLPRSLFPDVCEADQIIGRLTSEAAELTGLNAGTPVFAPIGDHQASFLGSVTDREHSVLVNVGTGAQVAVYTDDLDFVPPIELRPFPGGGNLLSNVGLAGGWSYQVLEQFFRDIGRTLFDEQSPAPLYELMTRLAATVPAGADGLRCEPLFNGTRLDPGVRGSITGVSPQNFTASHLARAVLEGMARSLHEGYRAIQQITGHSATKLIAAGNGLRENPLLADIVSGEFGLSLTFTTHREEAAYGAALVVAKNLGH